MLFIDNRHMWLWHVLSSAPTTSGSGSGDDDVHGHGQWRHKHDDDDLRNTPSGQLQHGGYDGGFDDG